ncbi:hypothetical protein DL770_007830 [Monosporascus sp. CRB-9-2]|nr:hypothetical protein DL770_007830 [Monosporascus sp. CRB-9-2]
MPSQTVFRWTSRNGFDGLQAFQESIPTPGQYEVLVKVRSVSLNYRDVAIANSRYPLPMKDNVIPCSDMAGEIVQMGDRVKGFSVGDRVLAGLSDQMLYGPFNPAYELYGSNLDGMLRQYVALPAHGIIKLPDTSHTLTQWAALACTGATVWNAFYGGIPLKPGDRVLIQGTGGVSLTALTLAKAAGAITIITSSSDEKLEYVQSKFGADHTINYKTYPNWEAEVLRITNGEGVDHVIENGGEATIRQSLEAVAFGGVISLIGVLGDHPEGNMPGLTLTAMLKNCTVRGILGGSKQLLEGAVRFVGRRGLMIPIDRTFGYSRDEIIAALEYVAAGKQIGKVCINLD